MTGRGGVLEIGNACISGLVLVFAIPALLGGQRLLGHVWLDRAILLVCIALAIWSFVLAPVIAVAVLAGCYYWSRAHKPAQEARS